MKQFLMNLGAAIGRFANGVVRWAATAKDAVVGAVSRAATRVRGVPVIGHAVGMLQRAGAAAGRVVRSIVARANSVGIAGRVGLVIPAVWRGIGWIADKVSDLVGWTKDKIVAGGSWARRMITSAIRMVPVVGNDVANAIDTGTRSVASFVGRGTHWVSRQARTVTAALRWDYSSRVAAGTFGVVSAIQIGLGALGVSLGLLGGVFPAMIAGGVAAVGFYHVISEGFGKALAEATQPTSPPIVAVKDTPEITEGSDPETYGPELLSDPEELGKTLVRVDPMLARAHGKLGSKDLYLLPGVPVEGILALDPKDIVFSNRVASVEDVIIGVDLAWNRKGDEVLPEAERKARLAHLAEAVEAQYVTLDEVA